MDETKSFGDLSAADLCLGDIVEWSKWVSEIEDWESYYGIVTEIKTEVKGNRMVSVSMVMPLSGPKTELKFFTPSLKLVSRGKGNKPSNDFNS